MLKVIIIGGPPMIGKSTLAIELASRLKFACCSTDDIGESLRAIIDNQIINPMKNFDYREYYISKTNQELITEAENQHLANWPSILAVIKAHLNWGKALVFEGWNFYPKLIDEIINESLDSLWLVAEEDLLKNRILKNKNFYSGASNPNLMIEKYLERSVWHNNLIGTQAKELGYKVIEVTKRMKEEDVFNQCKHYLSL